MKNKKQMAAVLLSAILGITANAWFVQANSSVIQDEQQEPDSETPDLEKVTAGTDTYKGFLVDNILHSDEEGDILSDEEINDLLVLDVKADSYFSDRGVTNQHGRVADYL